MDCKNGILYRVDHEDVVAGKFEIPEGTIAIMHRAFAYLDIEEIRIPDTVSKIYSEAFIDCEKLRTVIFGKGVKFVEKGIFSGCVRLEKVYLPNSITEISDSMFNGCISLKKIYIPDSVKKIGDSAFFMSGLKSVFIPKSVKEVGRFCFAFTEVSKPKTIAFACDGTSFGIPCPRVST